MGKSNIAQIIEEDITEEFLAEDDFSAYNKIENLIENLRVLLKQKYLEIKFEAEVDVLDYNDYEGVLKIYATRNETPAEVDKRIKQAIREVQREEKEKTKEAVAELQLYKRLHKKYGKKT